MTIREAIDLIGIDEDPLGCAFVLVGVLRSVLQREPSTLEGDCASLVRATEVWGRMDDPANVRRMLASSGFDRVLDLDVPDRVWLALADAQN